MNEALVNFAAGETSPRSRVRFDLAWFRSSCEKILNFIVEVSGPARFRSGFKIAAQTRGGAVARLIPFQLNATQAYMLEFTTGKMRVYKDGALLTAERTTITAATKANPCVITVASTTGLANGDEIILTGVVGMEELNGRQFKLAGSSGSTFQLTDPVSGANINSTNWGTYVSGGTLREVYEIASPYLAGELGQISYAQDRQVMYLAHPGYAAQKLSVDSADTFTLATQTRTSDPFTGAGAVLTLANPGVTLGANVRLTFVPGTIIDTGAVYTFSGVTGTTQLNGQSYKLEPLLPPGTYPSAYIKTVAGEYVDGTAWSGHTGGGIATPDGDHPIAVAFYESRLWFLGTNIRPTVLFGSRAPNDAGAPRFDDFTGGADADHACFFALSPVNGVVDYIRWGAGTPNFLLVGTFGGVFRVSGGGLDEPITPSNVNVRQLDAYGCDEALSAYGDRPFYIQRGGKHLRSIKYSPDSDGFLSYDLLLNAEHMAESPLSALAFKSGVPSAIWVVREDGVLVGMTVEGLENVAGWHRHTAGGTSAAFLDLAVLPRQSADDQLWVVTERTINGVTRRYVEYQADDVTFPDKEDFYTGPDNQDDDEETYENAVYRRQEEYLHMDCAATYNGADRGSAAGATLTPGQTAVGTGVTFTASAAVFRAGDVGSELWKKPDRDSGAGSGRATITAYVSPTQVTASITVAFDSTAAIAAGAWHFAVDTIYVPHLDGETDVAVVADGAVISDGGLSGDYTAVPVTNCAVALAEAAAVVHIGLPYEGFLKTHNLALGGQAGPTINKPRNIVKMFISFLATLGADYGTDIYDLTKIEHRDVGNDNADRPAPVFTGSEECYNADKHERSAGKHVIVSQRLPLPCVVRGIDLHYDVTEEA